MATKSNPGPALPPTIFVLFGATGDLARRMVLPAFYRLNQEGLLPRQWLLVGNGRGDVAHEEFRKHVYDVLTESGPKPEPAEWKAFAERLLFAGGGFTSDSPGSLLDVLAQARASLGGQPQLVHYLAIPPVAFGETTRALGQHGLASDARVVYEKPFGTSPESFRSLDRIVHSVLAEPQVYRPLDPAEVVLGQFSGYRDVPGVAAESGTDTYVAARLWIDNPRWRGVPFYLRTGKRLAESRQRVSLILREAGPLARQLPGLGNVLSFSLAGDGEIDLTLVAKKPGPALELDHGTVSLPLSSLPGANPLPAYVRLIHDALLGDRSLFTRPDGLAAAWKAVGPLLSNRPRVAPYAPGSWGPAPARKLIAPGRWLLGQ